MRKINPDKLWKLFNQDIQKYIKENNFYLLGSTYYEMAGFVKNEGKDNTYLKNLGYQTKLKFQVQKLNELKNSGMSIEKIEIIATDNSCEACKNINGKIFPLNEALSLNLLPVKECSFSCGCRCVYGPSV